MLEEVFQTLEKHFPEMVSFRRDLHQHPELSFQEVHTPEKIATYLKGLGIDVRTGVGGRGVVGRLVGALPGKTIALRADFDALPIQDLKDVEYASKVPGVMHACGHDIHTAALLGVASVLSQYKQKLQGTVVFIHQFAEERPPGGAKPMIEDGCLEGVDVIYGAHVLSEADVGTVCITPETAMAAGDRFEITVHGKGGHGAKPHTTIDAVHLGTQVVNQLHHLVSRRIDPLQSGVVSVGTFNAGAGFNVIAEHASITGTVRAFEEAVRSTLEEGIKEVAKQTVEAGGGSVEVAYERGYPSLYNHPAELAFVEEKAKDIVGSENVLRLAPSMGMEDFAYYVKEVPGAFVYVGGRNPEINATYPHHNARFDVDETSMLTIGKLFLSLVLDGDENSTT
ncbi:M20 metallopeptidase family protein [Aureibacillus halotolerans]|uniref:Amidohydrolase n=1 Tax=Aureibacillus halotolerans TaxID=1508390 RepID=A0A4R6U2C4_9BACI|nr:amidohydrolase [Aureibacillus halotolerans]TDQ39796.1 amidohydrolase [Aureibacillus halotolerans]